MNLNEIIQLDENSDGEFKAAGVRQYSLPKKSSRTCFSKQPDITLTGLTGKDINSVLLEVIWLHIPT